MPFKSFCLILQLNSIEHVYVLMLSLCMLFFFSRAFYFYCYSFELFIIGYIFLVLRFRLVFIFHHVVGYMISLTSISLLCFWMKNMKSCMHISTYIWCFCWHITCVYNRLIRPGPVCRPSFYEHSIKSRDHHHFY